MRAAALLLCLALAGLAGAAEVYKWTDKDGKVHFGDAPPPDAIDAQRTGITSAPTDTTRLEVLDTQQELQKKQSAMEDELRANQQQRAEEERANKQAACDAARKRYENLQHSRKFVTTGADGKESWMSGDEADKMKADLKAAADKACAGL
jgi:hypothetical protein